MKSLKLNVLIPIIKELSQKLLKPRVHYVFIADENGLYTHFNELKKKLQSKLPMVSLVYLQEKKAQDSLFTNELNAFRERLSHKFSLHVIKYDKEVPEDASSRMQRILELEMNCSFQKRIQFKFYGSNELAYIVSEKIELLKSNKNIIQSNILLTKPTF